MDEKAGRHDRENIRRGGIVAQTGPQHTVGGRAIGLGVELEVTAGDLVTLLLETVRQAPGRALDPSGHLVLRLDTSRKACA